MFRLISKRLFSALAVMFVVSLITFMVLKWIPGDPAQLILGTEATPESLEALRTSMGLNLPWTAQYARWLGNLLQGDWGTSYLFGENVRTLILQRLPVTFSVTLFSMILAVCFSAGLGIVSALFQGSWIDRLSRSLMQLGAAIPAFWLGMIFMILFAAQLHWFPVTGYTPPAEGISAYLHSLALPSIILAIGESGVLIRLFRSSMLSALNQDFMQSAQIKGLPRTTAILKYALRSAMIAPITVIGSQTAKLFGGTVIIETIFALPGIGRLLLTSVEQRDIQLLQGIVLFITLMVVLFNFITDMLVIAANPLIRMESGGNEA